MWKALSAASLLIGHALALRMGAGENEQQLVVANATGTPGLDSRNNVVDREAYGAHLRSQVEKFKNQDGAMSSVKLAQAEKRLANWEENERKRQIAASKPKAIERGPGCCCHGEFASKISCPQGSSGLKRGYVCYINTYDLSDCQDMSTFGFGHMCLTSLEYYEQDEPGEGGCDALNGVTRKEKMMEKSGRRVPKLNYENVR